MTSANLDLPLRSGVGIVVLNKENKVFVAKRIDNQKNFWQMPQGGVNKDEDYLTVRFEDIIKNKDLSLELETLLGDKAEQITLAADIKSAIQKNVLKRTKKGIFYFETNLGFSEGDVREALSSIDNQEILLNIKSKIQ